MMKKLAAAIFAVVVMVSTASAYITFDNVNSDYKNSAMWDMYIFCADGREKMFRRIDLSEVMVVRIDSYLSISKFTALDILEAL